MSNASKSHSGVRSLCEGALMIALAEILSFMPLYKMPWGGAIDLAMLPIFIFCPLGLWARIAGQRDSRHSADTF